MVGYDREHISKMFYSRKLEVCYDSTLISPEDLPKIGTFNAIPGLLYIIGELFIKWHEILKKEKKNILIFSIDQEFLFYNS